jgi:O-antigen/teichoic acid export membrane protein
VLQVILVPATVVARVEMRQSPAAPEAQAALRRLIREVALFSFPACAGLAAITPALFSLWLGDRWIGAGAATEITVLSIAPWTFFYCASAAMMSLKLSRLEVLVQGALSATSAAAVILAAPFGLNGVCAALVLRLFVLSPLPFGLLRRYAGLTMRPLLLAPVGLAAAAAVMGVIVSLASPGIVQIVGRWAALPALIGLGVVLFGAMAFFLEPLEVRRLLALSGVKSRTAPSAPRA